MDPIHAVDVSGLNLFDVDEYRVSVVAQLTVYLWCVFVSMVQVLVRVEDVNEMNPLFDAHEYNVTVPENASLHHSVAQVTQLFINTIE